MGPGGIRVSPEQLLQVSAQLKSGAANIESVLQQLKGQVEPLGSDWASTAQQRFMELWAQWQSDGLGLQQALTEIAQLMSQAASSYTSTDQDIAGRFRGM